MNTFETAAIISLVDHLSGPLNQMAGKVAGHEGAMARSAAKMAEHGRRMTMELTLPIAAGMKEMADKALEFSRIENTMRGVLEQRARSVDNLTMSTKAYAAAQMDAAKAAAQSAYNGVGGLPKGLVNVKEYQESVLAAVKAGYQDTTTNDPTRSMIPAEALSNQAAVLAVANRTDAHTATDDLIALSNALQVETRDKSGHTLGLEELNRKFGHVADVLSTMYTSSNFSGHDEVVQSLKMAAPLARFGNLDLGQIAMMSATQKEAGFRGDESSIAQRSMIGSFLSPKTSAYGAFKQIGLDLRSYQNTSDGLTAEAFEKHAQLTGFHIAKAQVEGVFAKFRGEGANPSEESGDLDKLTFGLRDAILSKATSKKPLNPAFAQKLADKFVDSFVTSTDVPRMIEDIRNTHKATVSWWAQVGEKRQAPRLLPILNPPATKEARDEFVNEGQRQYGPNWEMMMGMKGPIAPGPTPQGFVDEQAGIAARQAAEHAKSLEGAYKQVGNAFEMVVMKMADQHVFDAVANDIVKVMDAFAQLDPHMIKLGVDAAMFAAAIGPVESLLAVLLGVGAAAGKAVPMLGRLAGLGEAAIVAERAVGGTTAALRSAGATARGMGAAVQTIASRGEQAAARLIALEAARAGAAEAGEQGALAALQHGIAERASMEAQALAEGAQRFADRSAGFVRAMDGAAVDAMRKLAEVGADAAKAAAKFDAISGAADRAAAVAGEKYARLASLVGEHAEQALARSGNAIGEAIGQAEKRLLASGDLLGKLVAPTGEIERALGVAQRAADAAAQAATSAEAAAQKVLATQAAKGQAEDAAAKAATRLADAINAAAKASEDAAMKGGAAKAAESAAQRAGLTATDAAAKAASTAADAAARGSAEAYDRLALKHANYASEAAAKVAEQAASKARLIGMAARGLGLVSGVGDVAFGAQSLIEIGTARRDRENDVDGQIRRRYDADAALKHRMDFSTFYDREYGKIGFNPYRSGIQDNTWEQARRSADEFRRDPEGARGRAAVYNDQATISAAPGVAAGPAAPTRVEVSGDVKGTAEVHATTSITIEPSTYFMGLVRSVEHLAQINLTGKVGEQMTGSNGVKPGITSAVAGVGHM